MLALEKSLQNLFEKGERDEQQKKAWETFLEQGLPDPTSDPFRYLPMESLYEETLSHLKSLNYDFSLPKNIVALPLEKAKKQYGSLFFATNEKNPFIQLSNALTSEGFFLYIPPKTILEEPLNLSQILHENALTLPNFVLFVGEGSQVKITRESKIKSWTLSSMQIVLERGAQVRFEEHLDVDKEARFFGTLRCRLGEEALFQSHTFRTGEGLAREDATVALKGERAEAILKGAALLKDKAEHHVQILAHHFAPYTLSHQHFKNILYDASRASFEGKIYVEKEALKTDAYQLTNHLLLDSKASAFSKPNLEIFADDVKASHGATVSEVNRNYLHYLKTRGIDEKLGTKMLLKGFLLTLFENTTLQPEVTRSL